MKVFIFGPPGAGKSTFAFACSRKTGLPVYHLDHYFFKAPNLHVPSEKAITELRSTLPADNWIIEGNHGDALPLLTRQADHIIILDVPPLVCTFRIIKRYLQRSPELRKAVSEGWEENLSWQFIWFTLRIFPKHFPRQIAMIKDNAMGKVYQIRNVRKFSFSILT